MHGVAICDASLEALQAAWEEALTVALMGDLFYQTLDLLCQGCLLVKLILGLANVLAYPGPQLHLLVVAEAIISRPRPIARHDWSIW